MEDFIITKIDNCIGEGCILRDEPLKNHTTFKTGGPAEVFLSVKGKDELSKLLKTFKETGTQYFLLGNGSNLLVSDKGLKLPVIRLEGEFRNVTVDGESVYAGAGALLSKVCMAAKDGGLTGMEFAYGIPGTIGGAMVMNAGAYDGEMKDIVKSVELMDEDGCVFTLSCEEMEFGYRTSILKRRSYVVTGVEFLLQAGNREEITAKMADIMERRRSKQPLEHPSAGSTFKRPEGYFAGKLIMDAGLAGARVGGASVSPKHCGFIVNDEQGTSDDVRKLMKLVSDKVEELYGVKLEPEVIFVGDFD